jgi:hypothetical protein
MSALIGGEQQADGPMTTNKPRKNGRNAIDAFNRATLEVHIHLGGVSGYS